MLHFMYECSSYSFYTILYIKIRYRGNVIEKAAKKNRDEECFNSWSLRLRAQNCVGTCLYISERNVVWLLLWQAIH